MSEETPNASPAMQQPPTPAVTYGLPRPSVHNGALYMMRDVFHESGNITCECGVFSADGQVHWFPCPEGASYDAIMPFVVLPDDGTKQRDLEAKEVFVAQHAAMEALIARNKELERKLHGMSIPVAPPGFPFAKGAHALGLAGSGLARPSALNGAIGKISPLEFFSNLGSLPAQTGE